MPNAELAASLAERGRKVKHGAAPGLSERRRP